MLISNRWIAAAIAVLNFSASAIAKDTAESACHSQWQSADVNRNGLIDLAETMAGSLNTTREMFLDQCLKGARGSEPRSSSQASIRDDIPHGGPK